MQSARTAGRFHRPKHVDIRPAPADCRHFSVSKRTTSSRRSFSTAARSASTAVQSALGIRQSVRVAAWSSGDLDTSTNKKLLAPGPTNTHITLPPEIRNRIYSFVLTSIDDEENPLEARNSHPKGLDTCCLSLLLVSKQTYLESYHVFCRCNKLRFSDQWGLELFLKNTDYRRRLHITHIAFMWHEGSAGAAFKCLEQHCPNLRYLDVHLPTRGKEYHVRKYPPSTAYFVQPAHAYPRFEDMDLLHQVRGLEAVRFFGNGCEGGLPGEEVEIDLSSPFDPNNPSAAQYPGKLRSAESLHPFTKVVRSPKTCFERTCFWNLSQGSLINQRGNDNSVLCLDYRPDCWEKLVIDLTALRFDMLRPRLMKYQTQVNGSGEVDLFETPNEIFSLTHSIIPPITEDGLNDILSYHEASRYLSLGHRTFLSGSSPGGTLDQSDIKVEVLRS